MALTYTDSASLMTDITFRGRVKVACLNFASYIAGEEPTTPAHNTREKWANNCLLNPDVVAQQVQPAVVMDPNVQQQGSTISDADLQTATETAINKIM